MTYTIAIYAHRFRTRDRTVTETLDRAKVYAESIGKTPVLLLQDRPGPCKTAILWAESAGIQAEVIDLSARRLLSYRYYTDEVIARADVCLIFGRHIAGTYAMPLLRAASIPVKEIR